MRTSWHAIGFTKTRGWEARDRQDDELQDYEGLLAWCARHGVVSRARARHYGRVARARPAQARRAVAEARALRAVIYHLLRDIGTGHAPRVEQLDELTGWMRRYAAARRLVTARGAVTWEWSLDPDRLDHVLAPVAWSAAELLVSPERARVRLCDGDDCGWLFVDASRSGTRRWCDMADCGNLAKTRRFRARLRSAR